MPIVTFNLTDLCKCHNHSSQGQASDVNENKNRWGTRDGRLPQKKNRPLDTPAGHIRQPKGTNWSYQRLGSDWFEPQNWSAWYNLTWETLSL